MPVAVDKIIKNGFDTYRGCLPPILLEEDRLKDFILYNGDDLKKMRHWKSNPLKMQDAQGNTIVGAFDDLLYNPTTDVYAFLDYKTTGKEPTYEFGQRYYQKQCDIYTRFLEVDNRKVADFGVLLFAWPVANEQGTVDFASRVIFLKPNTQNAEDLFKRAMVCLNGLCPGPSLDCEYCKFISQSNRGVV